MSFEGSSCSLLTLKTLLSVSLEGLSSCSILKLKTVIVELAGVEHNNFDLFSKVSKYSINRNKYQLNQWFRSFGKNSMK